MTNAWGRFSSLALTIAVLIAGQTIALAVLVWWYGMPVGRVAEVGSDGVAVTLLILVSTPIEILLLALLAQRTGASARDYLGWTMPRRADLAFGIAAVVAFIILMDAVSWAAGRNLVTSFQKDIYTTAAAQGWLALLWISVIVITPIGEETLFRGFLFRGLFREPKDAWPAIIVTALLFAIMHLQYDWSVLVQVFGFGVLLGWLRWVSGSTVLTIVLHALINLEGMIETALSR
jgi:membrane protease YdiL (CAAX protease family)